MKYNTKSLAGFALISLGLLSADMAAAQSAYFQAVTNLNPVGYWPMHETTAAIQGNIETNYGTLGVLGTGYYPDWVNPSATAIKRQAPGALAGDSDSGVYFAGAGASNRGSTTNALYVPHTSPLSTLNPPFTVECWFYPTNSNQNDVWGQSGAAGLNNGANWAGIRLYWNPGFIVYAYNGQSGSTLNALGSSTGNNVVGQWYHAVVTADANTNISLYVNDALQFTTAASALYAPDYWTPFEVGCSRGNTRAVAGIIDEVAIYTNDLSAAVIDTHYSDGTNGPAGQYATDVLANNPVIYFRMNAPTYTVPSPSSWTIMTNYGSVGGDGLYTPGTTPGVVAGPSRSGVPFGGLSGAAVPQLSGVSSFGVASNTSAFNPVGPMPFTISALFRCNPIDNRSGNWETIVGHSDSSWRIAMNINGKLHATNPSFTLSNAPVGYSASFICQVTNFVGSASTTAVNVSVIAPPTAPYPVKVLADGPSGYWRLNELDNGLSDGNAGVTAHDYWGGDNGAYTNVNLGQAGYQFSTDPTTTSAGFGMTGISTMDSYAGQINRVDFAAPINASSNFSIEVWVNGAGQSISGAGIVTKGYGNGGEQFDLDYFSGGLRFFVRDAAGITHGYTSTVSPDSAWHHVVGVCNQSGGVVTLYIDGRVAGTAAITPGSGILAATNAMTIGSRRSSATTNNYNNQFYGNLNDVAVYGYALSASQVQDHYTAAGVPPYFAQTPPLTATANEGGTLTLAALTIGTPPLTNTWFDLTHGTNVAQTTATGTNALDGTLVVGNVPAGWNGGNLQLTAANAFGTTNVPISLTVASGLPVFLQNLPPAATTPAGKQYTYSVVVQGAVPFHYQWYSNGVELAGQTASSYSFDAASANYSVVVTNAHGPATSTVSALTAVASPSNAYAVNLLAYNPVGYWPLQETNPPAVVAMETNLGTLGRLGNAFYAVTNADGSGTTGGNTVFGQTGALSASGDTDPAVQVSGPNAVNYAFVPRATPGLTLQPPLTMEAWINSSSTAFGDIMGQGGSGLNSAANGGNFGGIRMGYGGNFGAGPNLVGLVYTGNGGTFNVGGTNIETVGNSVPFGQWNHCVMTYDGTNVLLYVNGTQQGSGTTPMALDTWSPLTIGSGRWQGGNTTRAYTGLLDEVAIYTNVLSPAQIGIHWLAGTTSGSNYSQTVLGDSPLLYYRMNCVGYTTPNPLTFPTAVNYGSAPVNGAYVSGTVPGGLAGPSILGLPTSLAAPINGVISCVNAGYDPTFNPTGTQPFTVMTWFKSYPSDGVVETLLGHGQNWAMNLDGTTGRAVWNLGSAGNVTSSTILNDGNWHFVAGVYNSTTSSLYVDGGLNGSIAAGALSGDSANSVWLGGNATFAVVGGNERYFAGALAQAAVFTNALSASQIQQIYKLATVPTISLALSGDQIVITYTGTLLSSTNVAGPYQAVSGATSPYSNAPAGSGMFYRTRNP